MLIYFYDLEFKNFKLPNYIQKVVKIATISYVIQQNAQ